jgi:release factor glutamine methyltransferase
MCVYYGINFNAVCPRTSILVIPSKRVMTECAPRPDTVKQARHDLIQCLRSIDPNAAAFESGLILQHVLTMSAEELILYEESTLSPVQKEALEEIVQRRLEGEPLGRIFGKRDFYGLSLRLSPATLEPRQDSETLVDAVLCWSGQQRPAREALHILDLGTGSGALVLAVLHQRPGWQGVGVDVSFQACQTAQSNGARLGLQERCRFLNTSWFNGLNPACRFDVIVSNPPYIATAVISTLDRSVKNYDPLLALDGGEDGLAAYRIILAGAASYLRPGGQVFLEIGYDQQDSVSALAAENGFETAQLYRDLAGHPRVLQLSVKKSAL